MRGPFAHLPDGAFGPAQADIAQRAIADFSRRAAAPMGRMVALVGRNADRRRRDAGPIAAAVAAVALAVWRAHFAREPNWTMAHFTETVAEAILYQTQGAAFHFGDGAVKELVIAHAFDLVLGHMLIEVLGGRRDALPYRAAVRPDTAGRDGRILRGDRPYTGVSFPAALAAPAP